jgi:hypothetical protein
MTATYFESTVKYEKVNDVEYIGKKFEDLYNDYFG